MWVLLWAKINCASGIGGDDREERYEWVGDGDVTDEVLMDYAYDFMESHSWMQGVERVKYGFERVGLTLPPAVAEKMAQDCERKSAYYKRYADFIRSQGRPPPEPRSRFEREPV